MSFPRGIGVEFCYVVPQPLRKTVELHGRWNPTRHPELKVYLHSDLPAKPTPESFKAILSAPNNSSVRSFVSATGKIAPGQTPLLVSNAEAALFQKGAGGGGGAMPADVESFWSKVLAQRAGDFAAGGLPKQPPIQHGGETIKPSDEAARLLKDAPKVNRQFASYADSLVRGGPLPGAQNYWELSDVEGTAAVSLGAFSSKPAGESWQALDLHYYASGGYIVLLTFYQMWPVTIGSQPATLVWRVDLLSAPSLAGLRGVERIASGTAMSKDIQKTILSFLKDIGTK
jgi:hypothetical protein